ncbi:hypothetical protein AAFO90_16340 [Phaeobacter sp. CAU 1743]
MKHAPISRQHYDLYVKYNGQDSEISDLLGECGLEHELSSFHIMLVQDVYVHCVCVSLGIFTTFCRSRGVRHA